MEGVLGITVNITTEDILWICIFTVVWNVMFSKRIFYDLIGNTKILETIYRHWLKTIVCLYKKSYAAMKNKSKSTTCTDKEKNGAKQCT